MKTKFLLSYLLFLAFAGVTYAQVCPDFVDVAITDNTSCDFFKSNGELTIYGLHLGENYLSLEDDAFEDYHITLHEGSGPFNEIGSGHSFTNLPSGFYTIEVKNTEGSCQFHFAIEIVDEFLTYALDVEETIPEGTHYVFGSDTLTEAGVYSQEFTTILGCDSVVTLNLSILPTNPSSGGRSNDETHDYPNETQSKGAALLFPNPANNDITVSFESWIQVISARQFSVKEASLLHIKIKRSYLS